YDYYNLNKPNQVIDFSVNTNPLGMSNELVNNWSNLLERVADYPDPHNTNLLERLSNKLQINQSHLLLGNGSTELISLIAFYLRIHLRSMYVNKFVKCMTVKLVNLRLCLRNRII